MIRVGARCELVAAKTMRRTLHGMSGRLTRSARRSTLHLPQGWPWVHSFQHGAGPAALHLLPGLTATSPVRCTIHGDAARASLLASRQQPAPTRRGLIPARHGPAVAPSPRSAITLRCAGGSRAPPACLSRCHYLHLGWGMSGGHMADRGLCQGQHHGPASLSCTKDDRRQLALCRMSDRSVTQIVT